MESGRDAYMCHNYYILPQLEMQWVPETWVTGTRSTINEYHLFLIDLKQNGDQRSLSTR